MRSGSAIGNAAESAIGRGADCAVRNMICAGGKVTAAEVEDWEVARRITTSTFASDLAARSSQKRIPQDHRCASAKKAFRAARGCCWAVAYRIFFVFRLLPQIHILKFQISDNALFEKQSHVFYVLQSKSLFFCTHCSCQ